MADYEIKQIPEDFIVREIAQDRDWSCGKYLIFRMKKKNYTTERAVQAICDALHIKRKQVGYAGSKDRAAMTEQLISIAGATKERVLSLALKDIELSFFGFSGEPLSLGDLSGNEFEITLRGLTEGPKRKDMIVNYFGEQRFSTDNAEIGKSILKKDYKHAIERLLTHTGDDEEKIRAAIEKNPTDLVGAIKRLPWQNLRLYIHAYQSLLWNLAAKMITEREHGKKLPKDYSLPIYGFGTEFSDPLAEEAYAKILREENVGPGDFVIKSIPELSSEGGERNLFCEIRNLEIGTLEEDDLSSGKKKVRITFTLGKGSYATEVVKALFS